MTTNDLKEKLLEWLLKNPHGASTRFLCNAILQENHAKYRIVPGKEKMSWVYNCLKALAKKNKVVSDYPGHWKIFNNHQK